MNGTKNSITAIDVARKLVEMQKTVCWHDCPWLKTENTPEGDSLFHCDLFKPSPLVIAPLKTRGVVRQADTPDGKFEMELIKEPLRNKQCLRIVRGRYPGPKVFAKMNAK